MTLINNFICNHSALITVYFIEENFQEKYHSILESENMNYVEDEPDC